MNHGQFYEADHLVVAYTGPRAGSTPIPERQKNTETEHGDGLNKYAGSNVESDSCVRSRSWPRN